MSDWNTFKQSVGGGKLEEIDRSVCIDIHGGAGSQMAESKTPKKVSQPLFYPELSIMQSKC